MIEVLLARLEALDEEPDAAVQRLTRTAESLRAVDLFLWAMVELERTELFASHDPEAAAAVLAGIIRDTATVQSPLLESRILPLKSALPPTVVSPEQLA